MNEPVERETPSFAFRPPSLAEIVSERAFENIIMDLRIPVLGVPVILPETGVRAVYWHGDFNVNGDSAVLLGSARSHPMRQWYFGALSAETLASNRQADLNQLCIEAAEYTAPNIDHALKALSGFVVANFQT